MIKSSSITFLVLVALLSGVNVYAQGQWNISPDESLSISLNNLRDSAEMVRQRNVWLEQEIKRLEQLIERTRTQAMQPREQSRYRASRVRDLGGTATSGDSQSSMIQRSDVSGSSVLQERLQAKSGEEVELMRAIEKAKAEIKSLRDQLSGATPEIKSEQQLQQQLRAKLEVSQINLEELNRRVEDIEIEQGGMIGRYQALRKANNLLRQKQTLLETYMKDSDAEKEELTATIKRLDSQNESFIRQIQGRIADLRSKGRNLEKVLDKATTKIRTNNIDFTISEQELEMLMENLTFIEQENKQLKSRFSRLESDWERLNNTGNISQQ